jgi:hypothetical protein
MKTGRFARIALAGVMTVAPTPLGGSALEPGGTFSDDDGSVHEASIEAIADVGITLGCNPPVNDLYCPDRAVTREQMASFLVRALGLPAGSVSFSDTAGSVHEASIAALAGAGITVGCNPPVNDMFCPKKSVTRGQMATFLVRALDLVAASGSFVDTAGSVHEANIGALAAAGITQGCNPPVNDMFCPDKAVTRAQMATFLTRALELDASPRVVVTTDQDLAGVASGTSEAETVSRLTSLFGPPTDDYMLGCPYIVDPPNIRYVEWGSLTVAIKVVDSGLGSIGLTGWRYKLDPSGDALPGGPLAAHIELPDGLELGDPIGDAAAAANTIIETTNYSWTIVEFGHFTVEATGVAVDPDAPMDGVQQGVGFDCE